MSNKQFPNSTPLNPAGISRRHFVGAATAALSAATLWGLSACGGQTQSSSSSSDAASSDTYTTVVDGKLTLVSNFYYPPFVFMDDSTGDFKGFDVDLYKEICKRLNLAENILPTIQFDAIVPTIKQGGKADVSIGAITITDERLKEIDFSDPYMDSNQAIVVKTGAAKTTQDELNAEGVKIAVQSATTGEAWAQENLPKATTVPLDDIIQALTGVSTGLYDACVTDLPVVRYEIKIAYSDLEIPEGGEIPTGEQYGIIVSKDNPNLTKAINKALADIQSDGTLDKIETTWFGTTV